MDAPKSLPEPTVIDFYRNALGCCALRCAQAEEPDAEPFVHALLTEVIVKEAETAASGLLYTERKK